MKNLKKIVKTLGGFTLAATVVGCNNSINEGQIVNKFVEPERNYVYLQPIAHSHRVGNTTVTTFTYIPILRHDDEDYGICIQGINKKGKTINRTLYVQKNRFDTLDIGQYFCMDKNCSKTPNPDKKLRRATAEDKNKYPSE